MNREKKQSQVNLAKNILTQQRVCVLFTYKGLNAGEFARLRDALKDIGANVRVIKNTLLRHAVIGTDLSPLEKDLHGQLALSYAGDEVGLANLLWRFQENSKNLKIETAILEGKFLDDKFMQKLAALGSSSEVKSRFLSLFKTPGVKLVRVLMARAAKI